MLIDSHCHLSNLSEVSRQELLNQVQTGSGYCFVDSGIDLESSLLSSRLSEVYSRVYSTLGFHPLSAESFSREIVEVYMNLIKKNKKIIGVGEIGLDYKATSSFKKQEDIFKAFIQLAKDHDLPITIHNRIDPQGDKLELPQTALAIIDQFFSDYQRVVFHCFSHSVEVLNQIIKKQGMVSFSLNILRKSKKILQSLEACPLENLILETDSPYMKIKDSYSTPWDIDKVYQRVSQVKAVDIERLKIQVFSNFKKVFSINPESSS